MHLLMLPMLTMLQINVDGVVVVVDADFTADVVVVVVTALYDVALVGFATSADVDVDAIVPVAATSGVFTIIAKPNVTDD